MTSGQKVSASVAPANGGTSWPLSLWNRVQGSTNEFTWIWVATIGLYAISAVVAPGTTQISSISATLPFAAILAVVAVGQTVVIQQRGLDLSCGPMISLGGAILARLYFDVDSVIVAALLTIIIAGLLGALNGWLIFKVNIMPIVATLATNAVFLGIIQMVTHGTAIVSPPSLSDIVNGSVLGIPNSLSFAILLVAVMGMFISRTRIGQNFVIVGAAPRTAAAAGIPVLRYQIGTYVVASTCFALAGIVLAGFAGSASHRAGNDYLLPSIAAVVVGGTSFVGGRGSLVASGIAALFMIQLGQMVQALGAGASVQFLVQALAIVVATLVGQIPVALRFLSGLSGRSRAG
jgi:ribose transport system permease protein